MLMSRTYSARELGEFARCTSAQLSYYHEIQLLPPPRQARHGGIEYDDVYLLRLQQIRIGRAAGLALEQIRRWLDRDQGVHPDLSRAQRVLPNPGAARRSALYVEVEAKLETDGDRREFQAEAGTLYGSLSSYQRSGTSPADERLRQWAERHQNHIDRWFCPCTAANHLAFARAIVRNSHLAASIERHGSDLGRFMLTVIRAQTS